MFLFHLAKALKLASLNAVETFQAEEFGSVSVDWLVLTSVCAGLGLGAASTVRDGAWELVDKIQSSYAHLSVEMVRPMDATDENTNDGFVSTVPLETDVSTDDILQDFSFSS